LRSRALAGWRRSAEATLANAPALIDGLEGDDQFFVLSTAFGVAAAAKERSFTFLLGLDLSLFMMWNPAPPSGLLGGAPNHASGNDVFGVGAIRYGGNFAVTREGLARIAGFDRSIEFHGEDTNLGRRLTPIGSIVLIGTMARLLTKVGR